MPNHVPFDATAFDWKAWLAYWGTIAVMLFLVALVLDL